MTYRTALAAAAFLAMSSPVWAQTRPSVGDAEFAAKASVGNLFEVEEAKLALQRTTDQRLKDFAQHMVDDHASAETKLKEAADKAGVKLETTLDAPHQAMLDNLKTFNGTDFDKIYVADQIAGHAETVNLLLDYRQNGQNYSLKSWASNTLPVVKGHQASINAM